MTVYPSSQDLPGILESMLCVLAFRIESQTVLGDDSTLASQHLPLLRS